MSLAHETWRMERVPKFWPRLYSFAYPWKGRQFVAVRRLAFEVYALGMRVDLRLWLIRWRIVHGSD